MVTEATPAPVPELQDIPAPAAATLPTEVETPPAAPAPEIDWKKRAEEAEAKATAAEEARAAFEKRARDEAAERGRAEKARQEADARAKEVERARRTELELEAYKQGISDPNEVAQHVTRGLADTEHVTAARAEAGRQFAAAAELGVDIKTDAAFEKVRNKLVRATKSRDPAFAEELIEQSRDLFDQALSTIRAAKEAPPAPAKPAEPAAKTPDPELVERTRALERARGVPGASGGSGGFTSMDALRDAYITGKLTPDQYRRTAYEKFGESV